MSGRRSVITSTMLVFQTSDALTSSKFKLTYMLKSFRPTKFETSQRVELNLVLLASSLPNHAAFQKQRAAKPASQPVQSHLSQAKVSLAGR